MERTPVLDETCHRRGGKGGAIDAPAVRKMRCRDTSRDREGALPHGRGSFRSRRLAIDSTRGITTNIPPRPPRSLTMSTERPIPPFPTRREAILAAGGAAVLAASAEAADAPKSKPDPRRASPKRYD